MKTFKKLAIFATALTLAFSFGAFAACGGGDKDNSSNSSPTESSTPTENVNENAYTFIVKNADGSAAQNVSVQLCTYNATYNACYAPVAVDANGISVYEPQSGFPGAGIYEIHLLDDMNNQVEFDGPTQTTAEYGEITLTLKN